jgi:hypothetical protein
MGRGVCCQAERRALARARREAFLEPPTRRNQVWQADFSEFETETEGTWQLGGVVDYVAKAVLACPVTATQTAADLLAASTRDRRAAAADSERCSGEYLCTGILSEWLPSGTRVTCCGWPAAGRD